MNRQKVSEMFYLWSRLLPIDRFNTPAMNRLFQNELGIDAQEYLRLLVQNLGVDCSKKENFDIVEKQLLFIKEACEYALELTTDYPKVKVTKKENDVVYSL